MRYQNDNGAACLRVSDRPQQCRFPFAIEARIRFIENDQKRITVKGSRQRYPLTLPGPGTYRAYADFTADGSAVVLGVALSHGDSVPEPLPPPSTVDSVDGLTVSYEGTLRTGVVEPLLFHVCRAGRPVPVQPYLGAYGHLTMLRRTDLGYLHIHPEPGLVAGAAKFWVATPSPGTYRMYLNFQVDGVVHTAGFTVAVP